MSPLLRLLRTFVPKLLERLPAAVVPYAPLLLEVIEEVFVELGGATQDFRPILAENQKLIDRLGDPDSFRNVPRPALPVPPARPAGKYESISAVRPHEDDYRPGDVAWQHGQALSFFVRQKGAGAGTPPEPWHETEFASGER